MTLADRTYFEDMARNTLVFLGLDNSRQARKRHKDAVYQLSDWLLKARLQLATIHSSRDGQPILMLVALDEEVTYVHDDCLELREYENLVKPNLIGKNADISLNYLSQAAMKLQTGLAESSDVALVQSLCQIILQSLGCEPETPEKPAA